MRALSTLQMAAIVKVAPPAWRRNQGTSVVIRTVDPSHILDHRRTQSDLTQPAVVSNRSSRPVFGAFGSHPPLKTLSRCCVTVCAAKQVSTLRQRHRLQHSTVHMTTRAGSGPARVQDGGIYAGEQIRETLMKKGAHRLKRGLRRLLPWASERGPPLISQEKKTPRRIPAPHFRGLLNFG